MGLLVDVIYARAWSRFRARVELEMYTSVSVWDSGMDQCYHFLMLPPFEMFLVLFFVVIKLL